MTSNTRNLDELLAEQNKQYARIKREVADYERQEREHQEQAKRHLADFEQRELEEQAERDLAGAETRDRWLRGVGYVTRTLVYFLVLALLYWWLAPTVDFSNRAIGSLTLKEIGALVGFVCVFIMWWRIFFNHDDDFIEWEGWGRAGLWIAGATVVVGLWFAYG